MGFLEVNLDAKLFQVKVQVSSSSSSEEDKMSASEDSMCVLVQ
jgi:hypothetical protein